MKIFLCLLAMYLLIGSWYAIEMRRFVMEQGEMFDVLDFLMLMLFWPGELILVFTDDDGDDDDDAER